MYLAQDPESGGSATGAGDQVKEEEKIMTLPLNDKWSLEWRIIDFMQVYNDRKKM